MQKETKTCKNCNQVFNIEPGDLALYEKVGVQVPPRCPECRFKRRGVWRNERTLYPRKCGICSKSIITMHHPKAPYPVYCNDCWGGDKWDSRSYAKDYDLTRPFFDQLGELLQTTPQSATFSVSATGPSVNSDYTNFASNNKDCYLIFNSGSGNENCAYSRGLTFSRDMYDIYYSSGGERMYEGVNVHKNSGVRYAQNVTDTLDSWLMLNCANCSNCFGCVNVRNGQYQYFNEQLEKEDYLRRVGEIAGSYKKLEEAKTRFAEHVLKFPMRENQNLKTVNSSGNYLLETKDCHECYETWGAENVRYSFAIKMIKDSIDSVGFGYKSELLFECAGVGNSQRIIASWWVDNSRSVEYSFATRASADCVGCVSLKNAKFCILNKEYGEEEYHKLREHIVNELKAMGEYGSFAPPSICFFGYNEAITQDNMPLTKEQALAQGFRWQDELVETRGKETLKPDNLPDHIDYVQDSILNETLACKDCGRNYRLIKPELAFYRDLRLPIPRQCWHCRYINRIIKRGPMQTFARQCAKCAKDIQTSFSPDRPEIVYCEQCYQQEVI